MQGNHRDTPRRILSFFLILLLLGVVYSCNDNPTDIGQSGEEHTGTGTIDPGTGADFLIASVEVHSGAGRLEVWGRNLAVESDSIVSFDLVLANGCDCSVFPPVRFVVTRIVPSSVHVENPDGYLSGTDPFFDFSDDLGTDSVLTPGEETAPVKARFRWTERTSFSIGFRLELGEPRRGGVISGVVFSDLNRNGILERGEKGIPRIKVELKGGPDEPSDTWAVTLRTSTDGEGRYRFDRLEAGVYTVRVMEPPGWIPTSSNPLLVTLVKLPDGRVESFTHAHFGLFNRREPPETIFGPLPVGPGSWLGTEVDTTFFLGRPKDEPTYFLAVMPPMLETVFPIRIDSARVWINSELVFRWMCPEDRVYRDCLPNSRRLIPLELLRPGEDNHIKVMAHGDERSYVLVSVELE